MSARSFPSMLVCALTLYIVVGCERSFSIFTIVVNMVLSAWLLCCVGCFMCVLITYIQLRQSVNMYAGSLGYLLLIILSIL